jgi:ATP-dependent Clp protease ATP-binding subunit ClpA
VKDFLAEKWRDPVFGARPLKRAIQRHLIDMLALGIIDGSIQEGQSVTIKVKNNTMIIQQK